MTTENKDQLIIDLVEELNWQVRDDHRVLALEALRAIGTNDATIKLYFKGEVVLGDVTATLTPAQPVSSDRELRAAVQPFVELWAQWIAHSTDEECADSEILFWQWLNNDTYLKSTHFRQLAAALTAGEQGGELWTT